MPPYVQRLDDMWSLWDKFDEETDGTCEELIAFIAAKHFMIFLSKLSVTKPFISVAIRRVKKTIGRGSSRVLGVRQLVSKILTNDSSMWGPLSPSSSKNCKSAYFVLFSLGERITSACSQTVIVVSGTPHTLLVTKLSLSSPRNKLEYIHPNMMHRQPVTLLVKVPDA